jgi:hypothetical protein
MISTISKLCKMPSTFERLGRMRMHMRTIPSNKALNYIVVRGTAVVMEKSRNADHALRHQRTIPQEEIMEPIVITYAVYLVLSVLLTVWVARTLHKNGRVFLIEVFGATRLSQILVNHLLVVGFYLINFGTSLLHSRSVMK